MALSSKITNFYIRKQDYDTGTDFLYRFTVSNLSSDIGQVNFNSAYDEAIDGSLRTNIRGFRVNIVLDWAKLTDATVDRTTQGSGLYSDSSISQFLGDLVTAFVTDGDTYLDFSFNTTFDSDTWRRVVPASSTLKTAYNNQIGRGSSNLEFTGQQIITSIPTELEAPSV